MPDDFYCYVLFRLDTGVPCYVGKGRGRRAARYENNTNRISNPRLARVVARHGVAAVLVREGLPEETAHATEIALIQALGRQGAGPLLNLTDGGEGHSGHVPSPETNERRSASLLQAHQRPEVKVRMKAGREKAAKTFDFEAASRAQWCNPETKTLRRKQIAEALARPEVKARHIAGLKAAAARPSTKALQSRNATGHVTSPEQRALLSAIMNSPEKRKQISDAVKSAWRKPEVRAKFSAARRGKPKSETTRAKMREAWVIRKELKLLKAELGL